MSGNSRKPARKMKVASDSETEPGKVSDPEDGTMSLRLCYHQNIYNAGVLVRC